MRNSPSVKGQYHQWRPLAQLETAVVGVVTEEHHRMAWVVAVVAVAVARVKNASTFVMGRKTEVFVEGAGLHDMVDVQRAVGVVGRSLEAGVGAVRVSECGQKQGGLN
jgi:hypothetical protein